MNKLVEGMTKEDNKTTTLNGMKIKKSSKDALVDLFYAIGSSRQVPENVMPLFQKAKEANLDVAVRIALYARDVRGGMGERKVFRMIINSLAVQDYKQAQKLVPLVPEVGRWDDLFAFIGTPVETDALDYYAKALEVGNSMAAKWAPREKSSKSLWAVKLRKYMGLTPRAYRKMLVQNTTVVEQQMTSKDKDWKNINFNHVPSLASARYQQAFERHAPSEYNKYLVSLEKGEDGAKINAGAVYPYDVIKSVASGNARVAEQQWKALPDWIPEGKSFLPVVDVSGSMNTPVGKSLRAMDISVSLGLYTAMCNKGVFKDKFLTFETNPSWVDVAGLSLKEAVNTTYNAPWGGTTDLEAVFERILDTAVKHKVPQEDMPDTILIASDMQFNVACRSRSNKPHGMIKEKYKQAGYDMPNVVYWNLVDYGSNTPVSFDKNGTALISGFSPAIMKSVLSNDIEDFTPFNVMLDAVMIDRYNWM